MTNECIPLKSAAYTRVITVHCTAGVTGKKFVAAVSGRQSGGLAGLAADPLAAGDGSDYITAGPPAANGDVEGVAMWDVAAGGKCPVISGDGTIVPVTAGTGGVTAGALVAVDNTGAVVAVTQTAAGSQPAKWVVGKALTAAAAGADAEVELCDPFLY
jgi:hypothetical protein